MRRRRAPSRRGLAVGGAIALLVALVALLSVNRYSPPPSAPPAALDRIAQKNRHAATVAAASQRAEAAASSDAVGNLVEAQRRGAAEAEATIAAYPDEESRNATAARGNAL